MQKSAQCFLFVPLLVGYWYAHGFLATWVQWVPELFSERSLRLGGILLGTVLCGAIAGLAFAGPLRLLYQRHGVAVAAAIAMGVGAFDAFHLDLEAAISFTRVALLLDLAILMLALPLCVLLLNRLSSRSAIKPAPLRNAD
jgi:H+/Cl- antiporter ClcA